MSSIGLFGNKWLILLFPARIVREICLVKSEIHPSLLDSIHFSCGIYAQFCKPGKVMKLSGEFIPNGDFKSTKKLTWLAKVTYKPEFRVNLVQGLGFCLGRCMVWSP